MPTTSLIADAIFELELYDDTEEARVIRALLAAVLHLDPGDASDAF